MPYNFYNQQEFQEEEKNALASWPTGADVSFKDGLAVQKSVPGEKNFAFIMHQAKVSGTTLIQPRAGVALIDEHIRLLKYLEAEGGADLLPTTIDAYTRLNRYAEAQKGIDKSLAAGTSLLNGFPAVNHGVNGCRRITDSVSKPVQVRHGTPDARLLAEITLAAGFTSFEGGGISYNIPYAKKVPLEKSIKDWQFVDRLCGRYEENGARINREPFGPLTGTLVPPCISHAVGIIEGILALEQGVKSLTIGYGQGGCIIQDIAAVFSLRACAEEWFKKEGFSDFDLTLVFHQWMGGFPQDEAQAFAVISLGSM
ncbi:MAG TPA: methylaspartate mutase subunit E, partial [Spirochaetia bacterium]|nr:methylaspartate mutase subunit E [Spirochaetia bacterium]